MQEANFDAGAELARLGGEDTGGLASFIGIVRAKTADGRRLTALTLEHYPGMTEKAVTGIAAEAVQKFSLTGCTVIHRVGRLSPGDDIVFVAAAAPHRAAALQAVAFIIDYLKTAAPFWKCESFEDGERAWVAARASDDQAAATWETKLP